MAAKGMSGSRDESGPGFLDRGAKADVRYWPLADMHYLMNVYFKDREPVAGATPLIRPATSGWQ